MLFARHTINEAKLQQECLEWFTLHQAQLISYARQQTDSKADVELLVTTTASQVARALCEGRVCTADLLPYTLRSIFNAAARLREQTARRQRIEQQYGSRDSSTTEHSSATGPDDAQLRLRHAVRLLPIEQATVITLHIWDEMPLAEVARQLKLPESTIRSRYIAALRKIKQMISRP